MTEPTRQELEERIVQIAENFTFSFSAFEWINGKEFEKFLEAWHDLKRYFSVHDDTEITLETFGTFIDFSKVFRHILRDHQVEPSVREAAEGQLESLEIVMDLLIREGVGNLQDKRGDTEQ